MATKHKGLKEIPEILIKTFKNEEIEK